MGIIHTKLRNRLHESKVEKTAYLKTELKRTHAQSGLIPHRKRRKMDGGASVDDDLFPSLGDSDGEGGGDGNEADLEEPAGEDDASASEDSASETEAAEGQEKAVSMGALARQLAQDVADDEDKDGSDDEELPPPGQIASHPRRIRVFFGTKQLIPLGQVFDYGAEAKIGASKKGVGLLWHRGKRNVEKERELYDLLEESDTET